MSSNKSSSSDGFRRIRATACRKSAIWAARMRCMLWMTWPWGGKEGRCAEVDLQLVHVVLDVHLKRCRCVVDDGYHAVMCKRCMTHMKDLLLAWKCLARSVSILWVKALDAAMVSPWPR